jgi:hypothetical protein
MPKTQKYIKYIVSEEWKRKRESILKRDKHTCQKCLSTIPVLQVHHLTYDRFGDEDDQDLITLCLDCHEEIHRKRRDSLAMGKEPTGIYGAWSVAEFERAVEEERQYWRDYARRLGGLS